MLAFLGFVFTLILGIKLTLFLLHLLLAKYGRQMGCGAKWTSDKGEYSMIVGATGPIGVNYALEFASMGFNLLLIGRREEKLKKVAQEVKEKYQTKEIKLVPVDFSHPGSVDTVKAAVDSVGQIAAMVNCMSILYPPKKFAEYPAGFNSELLNVAVVAPLLMIELVLPKMLKENRGVIINYNSMSGRFNFPFFSTFSACKSFMSTLSEILSVEYSSQGIIVQNVEPFMVQGYMTNVQQNALVIPAEISVFSSLLEAGLASTTYGSWKHKLVALVLHMLVFILGSRVTTKLIGCLMPRLVKEVSGEQADAKTGQSSGEDKKASDTGKSDASEEDLQSSKTSKEAPKEISKEAPKEIAKEAPKETAKQPVQDAKSNKPGGKPTIELPTPPPGIKEGTINKPKFGSSIGSSAESSSDSSSSGSGVQSSAGGAPAAKPK